MSAILGHHISIPEYKILKMVKYLATKQNANVSIANFDGKTPLQKSFDFNLNYVAKFLWHCEQLQKIGEFEFKFLETVEEEEEDFVSVNDKADVELFVENIPGNPTPIVEGEENEEEIDTEKILDELD